MLCCTANILACINTVTTTTPQPLISQTKRRDHCGTSIFVNAYHHQLGQAREPLYRSNYQSLGDLGTQISKSFVYSVSK